MIAIPLDNPNATTVSEEYIKAPFFALLDTITGYYKVIENPEKDKKIVEFIHENGADETVCHASDSTLETLCEEQGITIHEVPDDSITIDEVFEASQNSGGIFSS